MLIWQKECDGDFILSCSCNRKHFHIYEDVIICAHCNIHYDRKTFLRMLSHKHGIDISKLPKPLDPKVGVALDTKLLERCTNTLQMLFPEAFDEICEQANNDRTGYTMIKFKFRIDRRVKDTVWITVFAGLQGQTLQNAGQIVIRENELNALEDRDYELEIVE